MSLRYWWSLFLVVGLVGCQAQTKQLPAQTYTNLAVPTPGGIGKVYMGREIAQFMSHTGADWLERPSREITEQPSQVLAAMKIKPTDTVADIGAGSGYFSFRLSPLVLQGKVLAEDIQPEMLAIIESRKKALNAPNVHTILGTIKDPKLPANSVDVVLLVDAYHEFSYPQEMMQGVVKGLKPGGRLILIEYRGEDPLVPIYPAHKMTQDQARKEMAAAGLTWRETQETLPQQHLMIFEK